MLDTALRAKVLAWWINLRFSSLFLQSRSSRTPSWDKLQGSESGDSLDFEVKVWSKCWCLVEILNLWIWSRFVCCYFGKQNSTLGSVVPWQCFYFKHPKDCFLFNISTFTVDYNVYIDLFFVAKKSTHCFIFFFCVFHAASGFAKTRCKSNYV